MYQELIWTLPFVALLGCIAVLPLLQKHWWEKNFHLVSFGLATLTILYYLLLLHDTSSLLKTFHEYLSFIALIGSLYIVSSGIHIDVKGEATPLANTIFLFIAAVISNFLGTTGASMVFIRPWIRMNKYRITSFHIIFFIFVVSNIGGALTPIGDPPLFLGFLHGVPFFWVLENTWMIWLTGALMVLAIFFIMDQKNFLKANAAIRQKETASGEQWKFSGGINFALLLVILIAVFFDKPAFLREGIMLACALLSIKFTAKAIHESNDFSLAPIREVAILFFGIFATMLPALEWLEHYASQLGLKTPGNFYWITGALSSFLDNAPTYLAFLTASVGVLLGPQAHGVGAEPHIVAEILRYHPAYIKAISIGAVFFGAMTYIGNGPNFLVKSIAEQHKIKLPSFLGYILKFSLPILLPVFAVIWLVFFRSA